MTPSKNWTPPRLKQVNTLQSTQFINQLAIIRHSNTSQGDGKFDNTSTGWILLSRVGKLCSRAEFVPGQEDKPILKRCGHLGRVTSVFLRCYAFFVLL